MCWNRDNGLPSEKGQRLCLDSSGSQLPRGPLDGLSFSQFPITIGVTASVKAFGSFKIRYVKMHINYVNSNNGNQKAIHHWKQGKKHTCNNVAHKGRLCNAVSVITSFNNHTSLFMHLQKKVLNTWLRFKKVILYLCLFCPFHSRKKILHEGILSLQNVVLSLADIESTGPPRCIRVVGFGSWLQSGRLPH